MNRLNKAIGASVLGLGMLLLSASQAAPAPATGASAGGTPARDGQHDFDFNAGVWKSHITRILDPLTGAKKSIVLNGTVTVHPVWGGRAQLEEIEADGPNGHWEGLTLFLYSPQSRQWSQTFVGSATGVLSGSTVGEFKDGRGEFYSADTFEGRAILVRGVWSDVRPDSHRYEESYSSDGGQHWSPAFIATLTRERAAPTGGTY